MKNIVEIILRESGNHLNNTAVIDGKGRVTYRQLFATVDRVSLGLAKIGVKKYQRLALLCEDSVDYIALSLAALKCYAVIVPVPFGSANEEVDDLLKRINVNMLIFEKDSYYKNNARPFSKSCGLKKELFIVQISLKNKTSADFYKINPAFIRFTSGTTGESKGVVLSHESIIERTTAADIGLKINDRDQIIWALAMSFHFVVTILLFLRRGATIILSNRKFPESLLGSLKENKATFIYASPIHYNMMSNLGMFTKGLLSNVRMAVSTAVKLPKDIADKFYQKFGFELSEAYGIIEVGLPFINSSQDKSKRGSVGKILSGYKVKIVESNSEGLGKIYIKGRGFFDAYFTPWKRREDVLTDGYFYTGDLGRLDQEGFLFIVGRDKFVINFCGMKVFPLEVEDVLNQYPKVRESFVYSLPHAQFGQLPAAKIVLRNNKKNDFEIEDLRKFCYKHIAAYKVPKDFLVVAKLPKTISGKLKR